MHAEFEVGKETHCGYYLYNYGMLWTFQLFKGKKLLSYGIDPCYGRILLHADVHIVFFQFEDFRFDVYRYHREYIYLNFYNFQKISVYRSGPEIENKYAIPINEKVEDVILELENRSDTSKKEVFNIIFKLKNKYFVPNLYIDVPNLYICDRLYRNRERIYYSTLEEYLEEEKRSTREFLERLPEERRNKVIKENKNGLGIINYDHPEFITLDSFLDRHPVERIKARIAIFFNSIILKLINIFIRDKRT